MTNTTFLPYKVAHKEACLGLLRANTPTAFDPSEMQDFRDFLDSPHGPYFVMMKDGCMMGCGGYYIDPEERSAGLCWGMIDPAYHGQGFGQHLLEQRLTAIRRTGAADHVLIDTSQISEGFFAKFGFRVTTRTPKGIGPELDEVSMELTL